MSLALVRQALELVDQEGCTSKKRGGRVRPPAGQGHQRKFKNKSKKSIVLSKSRVDLADENIKKLLALSKPPVDSTTSNKIVERAIKQKPLADKQEIKIEEDKSILFPEGTEESFKDFEEELFCS